jgi:hypothetical protein
VLKQLIEKCFEKCVKPRQRVYALGAEEGANNVEFGSVHNANPTAQHEPNANIILASPLSNSVLPGVVGSPPSIPSPPAAPHHSPLLSSPLGKPVVLPPSVQPKSPSVIKPRTPILSRSGSAIEGEVSLNGFSL